MRVCALSHGSLSRCVGCVRRRVVKDRSASLSLSNTGKKASCLIIYTGGTIGMKPVEDGSLSPAHGYIENMLQTVPEFRHPDVPTYDVLEWADPLDSSDFSPASWITLAEQIEEHYYDYDGSGKGSSGEREMIWTPHTILLFSCDSDSRSSPSLSLFRFVVLHGTDTMAYTASALSFMLENLGKAVIVTGAMIPMAFPVSDAKRNLIISLMCAVNLDIAEVAICFDNVLLRGNRAKKLNPGTVNPFDSPNFPPLAEMGVRINLRRELVLPAPRRKFQTHTKLFNNIAVMVLVPGFDDLALDAFIRTSTREKPACLVLMLYGAGNAPMAKKGFLETIGHGVAEKGAIVVITSQCLHGSVDMTQYATGNALRQLGVIDGRDMTTEATVTKLAYLVGRGLRGSALKTAMESNLRGELTTQRAHEYTRNQNHDAGLDSTIFAAPIGSKL